MIRRVKRPRNEQKVPDETPLIDRWLQWILTGGVVLVPLFVSPTGRESFRLPKLLLLRGEGIILVAVIAGAMAVGTLDRTFFRASRWSSRLAFAALGWTAFTAASSTYPLASVLSLLTAVAVAGIFFAARYTARSQSVRRLVPIVAAGVIVVLFRPFAQLTGWNPLLPRGTEAALYPDELLRLARVGLLGNQNDVGTFLVLPALLAAAFTIITTGTRRYLYGAVAILLLWGIVTSRCMTAAGAVAVALFALYAGKSWKRALIAAVAGALLFAGAAYAYRPLKMKTVALASRLVQRQWTSALGSRVVAFAAAVDMAKEHPFTGVGPGRYGGEFFTHRLQLRIDGPSSGKRPIHAGNFAETHNDYLQVLAETGVAGLLLFLGALGLIARQSYGSERADPEENQQQSVAQLLAIPVAIALAVLSIAQFPLQLAATLVTYAFTLGMIFGWNEA